MNTLNVLRPRAAYKPVSNAPRRFTPGDAPAAASNRALRRLWAAEANRILRRTGDPDEARLAGAEMLVVALDCDEIAHRARRKTKSAAPVNFPNQVKRREFNRDGAADRAAEVIRAGGQP